MAQYAGLQHLDWQRPDFQRCHVACWPAPHRQTWHAIPQHTTDIMWQTTTQHTLYSGGWRSGSALVSINKVNLHRTRLVLRRVTMTGFSSLCGTSISVRNQPPRSTQPGHPFVGRRNEYQPQRMMTPCGWGVKAGMVCVYVAGKTVWSHCYTWAMSERFRGAAR